MTSVVTLVVMESAVLALTGVVLRAIDVLARSRFAQAHHTRADKPNPHIPPRVYRRAMVVSSVLSPAIIMGVTIAFRARLFAAEPVGVLRAIGETVAILFVYDFAYYFMHRFAFHGWSVGRKIHAFHHSIRTPYVNDSLYTHPVENAAGVLLFLAATAVVGPVGLASFGLAFFVYSTLNLWNHSGIELPYAWCRPLTGLVRCHDVHHESMKAGYYSTVTPVWDVIFGTARRPARTTAEAS